MREEYVYESPPLPPDEDVYSEKIPAAVELLISYLEVAGLSTDDLFGGDPTVRELNDVIGSLSSGRTRDVAAVCRGSAQLAAASLAAYIRSLPEPLVGPPHYEALCAAVDIEPYGERVASVRDTLGGMPESTQTVLHRLFRFLSTLASRSAARGNSAEALAQVWTAMITPTYERGRALLRNEFRLVGLLLQQYACIFEGSLDAYEAPELPLPATLAGGGGNWVRTKASLLRDSQGRFKIQVREDECGIYLDVIAPTDVADDRGQLRERDYLVTLQRRKVEQLTLPQVRNLIRDAGSILEMEVRRYVTSASAASEADRAAAAERQQREAAQLERYQQQLQQQMAAHPPQAAPLFEPDEPAPPSHHAASQQPSPASQPPPPSAVRYASRQALSFERLPTAAAKPPASERGRSGTPPSSAPSSDLLGLDLLSGPPVPAAAPAPPAAIALGSRALYRSQTVTVTAIHRDDPSGDYYTVKFPSGELRDVDGPLHPLPPHPPTPSADPPAGWASDLFGGGGGGGGGGVGRWRGGRRGLQATEEATRRALGVRTRRDGRSATEAPPRRRRGGKPSLLSLLGCSAGAGKEEEEEGVRRAALRGDVAAVGAWLEEGGGRVDAPFAHGETRGATLLMLASARGQLQLVEELLRRGAALDLQTQCGTTALMAAAANGRALVVSWLLEEGADRRLRTRDGVTALDYARRGVVTRAAEELTAVDERAWDSRPRYPPHDVCGRLEGGAAGAAADRDSVFGGEGGEGGGVGGGGGGGGAPAPAAAKAPEPEPEEEEEEMGFDLFD